MGKTQSHKKDRNNLSDRQRKILDFIENFLEKHGYPPTIRDIGKAVEIPSTSVVNYNLNKLVREGYLERAKNVSRGLLLRKDHDEDGVEEVRTQPTLHIIEVPVVGQIVASQPVEFYDYHGDEVVELSAAMLGKTPADQVYALRVKGRSMVDAMVDDGDLVILRRQETAHDRDMVAALLVDTSETTLKYFFREDANRIRLQPANPEMDPIYVEPSKVKIQGRVIGVWRML